MKGFLAWKRRRSTGRRYVWHDDIFYRVLFEFRREETDWLTGKGSRLTVTAVLGRGSFMRSTIIAPTAYSMPHWFDHRKAECRINTESYWYLHSQKEPNTARLYCQDLWLAPIHRHVAVYLWLAKTTRIPTEVSPLCYLEQSGKR